MGFPRFAQFILQPVQPVSRFFFRLSLNRGMIDLPFIAKVQTIVAKQEVIVSCGTVSTPHLLQLSGIGDSAELQNSGIEPIVHLPDVGKNLQDHALFTQPYLVAEGGALDAFTQNETFREEAIEEWKKTRKGIMGLTFSSQTGWFRLPTNSAIFGKAQDPSSGPKSPHFAMIFTVSYT